MAQVNQTSDESAVGQALAEVRAAWAAGDAEAYARAFSEDADYTAFDGTRMVGRKAIADGHRALFAGIMKNSRMVTEAQSLRFITRDVAVVCERGGIVMSWQKRRATPSAKRRSSVTFVLVRHQERWSVTAFQNTRYRPWNRTLMGRMMTRGRS